MAYYGPYKSDKVTVIHTKIGYHLSGLINGLPANPDHIHTSMMSIFIGRKVWELNMEKFWEVEAAGVESTAKKSDNGQFQDFYEANCISYHGIRYVAKLSWKEEILFN